jgi:hypothetical protein
MSVRDTVEHLGISDAIKQACGLVRPCLAALGYHGTSYAFFSDLSLKASTQTQLQDLAHFIRDEPVYFRGAEEYESVITRLIFLLSPASRLANYLV